MRSTVRRIGPQQDVRRLRPSFVGLALLAVMLFLNLFVAPVVGGWGVAGLMLVWAVLVALSLRWFTHRPRGVLLLGVADLALWMVVVALAR